LEKYLNQVVTPVVIVSEFTSIKANTNLLTENDFRLAKSLLLTEGIKAENVDYNILYVVSIGSQTVAVSDFIYRPFNRSIMRGASRAYLQYLPAQGWTASNRIWRASPIQIYPEAVIKVAAHHLETDEIQLAEQTPEEAAVLIAALNSQVKPARNTVKEEKQNPGQQVMAEATPQVEKTALLEDKKLYIAKTPVAQSSPTPSPQAETEKKIEQPQKIEVQASVITRDKQPIIDFIESWRQAWISKQIEPYIAFYDNSFRSGDKNLAEW